MTNEKLIERIKRQMAQATERAVTRAVERVATDVEARLTELFTLDVAPTATRRKPVKLKVGKLKPKGKGSAVSAEQASVHLVGKRGRTLCGLRKLSDLGTLTSSREGFHDLAHHCHNCDRRAAAQERAS